MDIKYLKHHQIDKQKWDCAIENAQNGLVYALFWYLDIVSPKWDALILGNYKMVMPLTFKVKYGIKYLYKPFFSQFLGIFYIDENDSRYIKDFINEASKYFRFININLNVANSNFTTNYCIQKQTQVLSLSGGYDEIRKKYNRSTKNNVIKANKEKLIIRKGNDHKEIIALIKLMYKERQVIGVMEKDFLDLENIIKYAIKNEMGEIYYVYWNERLCAAAFFLTWKNRIISLQTANNETGKGTRALFRLLDNYINDNADSNMLLDFAGSNISGVASWNSGFGAITQYYNSIKINKLPIPLKWIKK
ncbi:hypothetical protein ACFLS4_04665 [Bacteroidota bacterium]